MMPHAWMNDCYFMGNSSNTKDISDELPRKFRNKDKRVKIRHVNSFIYYIIQKGIYHRYAWSNALKPEHISQEKHLFHFIIENDEIFLRFSRK